MNKTPHKTKSQHIVPQCYIKQFVDNNKQVYVFDKVLGRQYQSAPKNVAVEHLFYDFPHEAFSNTSEGNGVNLQFVEEALAGLESMFAAILDQLLPTIENLSLSPQQRMRISFFMAIQFGRTREARDTIVELIEKTGQATVNEFTRRNFPDASPEIYPHFFVKPEFIPVWQAQYMFDPENLKRFSLILFEHIWQIGINNTNHPLYTSDHPVALYLPVEHRERNFRGIASPGIQILFPLTPRHILLLSDRGVYKDRIPENGKNFILTEEEITTYNSIQVKNSFRQIFCSSNDFEIAEKLCQEEPSICDTLRERMSVRHYNIGPDRTVFETRRLD